MFDPASSKMTESSEQGTPAKNLDQRLLSVFHEWKVY